VEIRKFCYFNGLVLLSGLMCDKIKNMSSMGHVQ